MIKFIDERRGTKKGIPTLILGASSVNDVFVIIIFSILLGVHTGSDTSVSAKFLEIPESIILGIAIGTLAGYSLYHLFERYDLRATKMTIVIISVAVILTWLEAGVEI